MEITKFKIKGRMDGNRMLRYRTNVVSENPVLMPYTGNKTATLTKDLRMGEKNPNQSCTPVFKTYFLSE